MTTKPETLNLSVVARGQPGPAGSAAILASICQQKERVFSQILIDAVSSVVHLVGSPDGGDIRIIDDRF